MSDDTPFSIDTEARLAREIERLRTEAEMSYGELSRRMAEAGCPMDRSSLQKIEKGDPPRKITVNELMAFSLVFEVPVTALLDSVDTRLDVAWTKLLAAESIANIERVVKHAYLERVRDVGDEAARNPSLQHHIRQRLAKYEATNERKAREQAERDGVDVSTPEKLAKFMDEWDYTTPVTTTARDVLGRLKGADDGR